jgi:hypothetical protein
MTTRPCRAVVAYGLAPCRLSNAIEPQSTDPGPGIKPGLTVAAAIEPLLSIDDLATILNCSRRLVERMRSAGKVPKPDMHVGRCPRWMPATIRRWIAGGGGRP